MLVQGGAPPLPPPQPLAPWGKTPVVGGEALVVPNQTHWSSEEEDGLFINGDGPFNGSSYGTSADADRPDSYYFYETEQLTFLWILLTLIVVGNSAVLCALLLAKVKKSRMNFFIMQLAFADLAVGLISVLTDIVWKMTVSWNAGNVACKLIRYLQVLVTYSSTYVLVALSIDRYDAITHPMKFSGSWRRARVLVAMAWIMSAIFSIPILILYEEAFIDGQAQCWIELEEAWKWQLYMTLVSVSLFIIPAFIISACYTIIVYTIWSKGKTLTPSIASHAAHAPAHTAAAPTQASLPKNRTKCRCSIGGRNSRASPLLPPSSPASEDLRRQVTSRGGRGGVAEDSKRASSRGLIPKAKIKTVKMTFVIVFVFIVCWSPYIVYDLLQVYGHIPRSQTQNAVATFIQSLAPLNSAANPLIYCLFSTHICRNLRKVPLLNWIAEKLCWCFPALREPLRHPTLSRSSDMYATMSDSLSRSSRGSTVRVALAPSNATPTGPPSRQQLLRRQVTVVEGSPSSSGDPWGNSNV